MTSRTHTLRRVYSRLSGRLPQAAFAVMFGMLLFAAIAPTSFAQETEKKVAFDIPAGDAVKALKQFSAQSGQQLLYSNEDLAGVATNEVKGRFGIQAALDRLLDKTPLAASRDDRNGAVAVGRKADPNAQRLAQKNSDQPASEKSDAKEGILKLETFEVMGSKLLNMDIKRSRDDAQPYVIFGRETIESAGATNLEDFFRLRLTMNTQAGTNAQASTSLGNLSQINLRGFGTNQTLILVDGHRVGSPVLNGSPFQPDINAIPLSAIERIEVLPTTASGIYGGNATGGVINIVMRRDYAGIELKLTYENTFDTDSAIRRTDLSAGATLEGGKTSLLLAASWSDSKGLRLQDRDLFQRGRRAIFGNNPTFFTSATAVPLGGTTNIRSTNGSPLFGAGSPNFASIPAGYAGGGGLAPIQANAGRYNLDPSWAAQPGGARSSLLNGPTTESVTGTLRRQFCPWFQAFVEASATNNSGEVPIVGSTGTFTISASAPNNPFGQSISVNVPTDGADTVLETQSFDRRVVGGVILKLPGKWQAEADYTWNQTHYASFNGPFIFTSAAAAAVSNGTVDVLRDTRQFPVDLRQFLDPASIRPLPPIHFTLRDAAIRLAGPMWAMPGGAATLSGMLEHRTEDLTETRLYVNPTTTLVTPPRSQRTRSAYLEALLPLIGKDSRLPLLHELSLQVAARMDDYTVNGTNGNIVVGSTTAVIQQQNNDRSIDPTVGLKFRPMRDLLVRASYGTGFVPPRVNELVPNAPSTGVGFGIDPRRGNQVLGSVTRLVGGNPNLKPESSRSWSGGMIFTPSGLPDLRLSIDYTRITKTDEIRSLSTQLIIDNELVMPERIVRGPLLPGDTFSVGPITFIDASLTNVAKSFVEAYDVQLDYSVKTASSGEFKLFALATWQTHFRTQLAQSQPEVENVGVTASFPVKLRASVSLTWKRGNWGVGWNSRYIDSYLVADPSLSTAPTVFLNQGGRTVPSQIYHDAFATYRWKRGASAGWRRWVEGMEIQAGVKNVFNTEPPFDASSALFYSLMGSPRLASYYVSVRKAL